MRFTTIKRYKRGATWPDGQPRYCTRCRAGQEDRRRRRRATTTAVLVSSDGHRLPVAYCDEHTPEETR